MSIIDTLRNESDALQNKQNEVINEIMDHFSLLFNSPDFEREIYSRLSDSDKRERKRDFIVEFWDHHDGCSDTHFSAGPFVWENLLNKGFNSRCYRGVTLYNIANTVGPKLLNLFEYHLKDLGFTVNVTDNSSWLKYYNKKVTISW